MQRSNTTTNKETATRSPERQTIYIYTFAVLSITTIMAKMWGRGKSSRYNTVAERDVDTRFFGCSVRVIENEIPNLSRPPRDIITTWSTRSGYSRRVFFNRKPTVFPPPVNGLIGPWCGGIIYKGPSRYRRNPQRWVPAECPQTETRFDGRYIFE